MKQKGSAKAGGAESRRTPRKDAYREQYGVIVLCDGEKHQESVYKKLHRAGYKCRVVCT